MLKKAVQHVIDDSSLHIGVEPAATALQQAKAIMEWGSKQENESLFKNLEDRLLLELNTCLPSESLDAQSLPELNTCLPSESLDAQSLPELNTCLPSESLDAQSLPTARLDIR